jgi:hypothetical protein
MKPALTALFLLCLAGCGGAEEPPADTQPPQIVATVPADGAEGVALDALIEIQFDEAVDNHSITEDVFYLEMGGQPRYGRVSYDLQKCRASLNLQGGLQADSTYTGVLGPGVRDLAGNRRLEAYRWSFRTRK